MDYTALGMRDRVGVNQQCQPRWITERLRPRRIPVKVLAAHLINLLNYYRTGHKG